jgi:transcription initiation factor TFIIIB Brf1 subunit/transcription initiation factor TFIIB
MERSLRLGRSYQSIVAASVVQALTESDAAADEDEIALASRWIICSMKL